MVRTDTTSVFTRPYRMLLPLLLLLCCLFLCPFSLYAKKKYVAYIGFSTDKPFWNTLGKSIQKEADKRKILLVDLTPTEPDAMAQGRLIDHAIGRGVDALIVGANSPSTLEGSLTRAKVNNIPVVAVDTRIDHPAVVAFVATDNHKGAALAGEYIVQHTHGQGRVLILGGAPGHPNGEIRKNGVISAAKKAGMDVILRYAHWKDEIAYQIANEEFRKGALITAVFSCWDPGIDTVSHVLDRLDVRTRPILMGFDGLPRTVAYISKGRVTATVAQDTALMGKRSVELVLKILSGTAYRKESLIAPFVIDGTTVTIAR